jgi:hypothetical protein
MESKGEGKVALKSCHSKYLCAADTGKLTWDHEDATAYEIFELTEIGDGKITLRSHHGTYLCAQGSDLVLVSREGQEATASETFIRKQVAVTQTAVEVPPASQDETTVPATTEIPLASEEKPEKEIQPLSLKEIVELLSAATNEDVQATLALLPESAVQKVLVALDALEAAQANMETSENVVVEDTPNTEEPVSKGWGCC